MTRSGASDPMVGRLLDGRYEIVARIARGGMATVYRANDLRLSRTVAVKVMHDGLGDDTDFARKFDREAKAAARLTNPHVVSVFDQGIDHGRPYIVMEYVEGQTLRHVLSREAPLAPLRALDLLEPVVHALASAHEADMVHRDVKPENILISTRGQIKVVDFGLARAITAQTATATQGLLIGTVSYLPPELVTKGQANTRSDVYSTGVVLFELLTGRKPHTGDTPIQVAWAHVHNDVPAPSTLVHADGRWRHDSRRIVPPYLDALVLACTRRDPQQRPADARVLLGLLRTARRALGQGIMDDPALTEQMEASMSHPELTTAALARPEVQHGEPRDTAQRFSPASPPPVATSMPSPSTSPVSPTPDARWEEAKTEVIGAANAAQARAPRDFRGQEFGGQEFRGQELGGRAPAARDGARDVAASKFAAGAPATRTVRRSRGPEHTLWISDGGSTDQAREYLGGESGTAMPVSHRARPEPVRHAPTPVAPSRDQRRRPPERRGRGLLAIVLVLLLGILVAVGGYWWAEGRYTSAPDLTGVAADQADQSAQAEGFTTERTTQYSETVPKGQVIATRPTGGERTLKSATITLVVSLGPERYIVPKVVGTPIEQASSTIASEHLKVGHVQRQYSDQVPLDQVISSDPAPGTSLKPGTVVTLVVSRGPQPLPITNWTGKKADQARAQLQGQGFVVRASEQHHDTIAAGSVISQDPASGTGKKGDTITLVVSKGPELAQVPRVGGTDEATARARLDQAGFKTQVNYSTDRWLRLNVVAGQQPAAGQQAPKGSTVQIWVS